MSATDTRKRPAKKPSKKAKKVVAKKAGKRATAKRPATKKGAANKTSAKKKSAAPRKTSAKKSTGRGRKPSGASISTQVGARNLTARTAEVRAQRRQRRRSVVIVLSAITFTAAGAIGAIRSPLLDIDAAEVVGASEVSVAEIQRAAAVPIGTSMVDLNPGIIAARVESIPTIRTANVRRGWDGVVRIEVTEREPTLALKTPAGFVLVDDDGRQVRSSEVLPDGFLPVIGLEASGIAGDPAPPGTSSVLRMMEAMTAPVRQEVSEVIVTGAEIALTLTDGGRAVFGDDREIEAKVVSLETLLLSVDMRCVHEIDLTVPSAPALSRIGEKGNPRDGLADLTKCS